MHRTARTTIVIAAAALLAAGCGGTPDIDEVSGCLEGLGLTVEPANEDDPQVETGVFATTDLAGASQDPESDAAEFTFALAAVVKDEDSIDTFEDQSREFAESASEGGKLEFESGTDGRYVWVAGGEQGSDAFDDAKDCVQP